jgi:ATP-binding cassette subfamily C protein
VVLFTLALLNQRQARQPLTTSHETALLAETFGETFKREAETVDGLGMRDSMLKRWGRLREDALSAQIGVSDATVGYTISSKTLRLFLQSAMLALGAWLAIDGSITPGMMIAASILMGRALAPVEQGIAQWTAVQRALRGWSNLRDLLERAPPPGSRTALPRPVGHMAVEGVTAFAPGAEHPTIRNVSFNVAPGQALGVIGPSAAGKSTLARVLVGAWQPRSGAVRLDGATLDHYDASERALYIGYLPQDVALFDATIAENIARLAPEFEDAAVVAAAKRAGAHELILKLPQGYDTRVGLRGARLSGGQKQRIGLARALYGDPPLVVLDEPNSSLDARGEQALIAAIRDLKEKDRTVIVMAHRPSAIAACDTLLVLDQGEVRAFGPRDHVLRETTANHTHIVAGQNVKDPARRQEVAPG